MITFAMLGEGSVGRPRVTSCIAPTGLMRLAWVGRVVTRDRSFTIGGGRGVVVRIPCGGDGETLNPGVSAGAGLGFFSFMVTANWCLVPFIMAAGHIAALGVRCTLGQEVLEPTGELAVFVQKEPWFLSSDRVRLKIAGLWSFAAGTTLGWLGGWCG